MLFTRLIYRGENGVAFYGGMAMRSLGVPRDDRENGWDDRENGIGMTD